MRRRSGSLFLVILGALVVVIFGGGALASPPGQNDPFDVFVFDARADLDLLADTVLGDALPPNWTGNTNVESGTAVNDLWFDNELLANAVFGQDVRPEGWFGATTSVQTLARNVRHDLEVMADQVYTDQGLGSTYRPDAWRGAPPIYRCTRALQNIIALLGQFYGVQPETPESTLGYCQAVAAEVEDDLISAVFGSDDLAAQFNPLILAVRGDLERLADERLGLNNRPQGWIGNRDPNSVTLAGDILLDLELLADVILGDDIRPAEWVGAIGNNPAVAYQGLRFNVEYLADAFLGTGQRPNGWQGEDPVTRCDPQTQNLIVLVEQNYETTVVRPDPALPNFCAILTANANQTAENPPVRDVVEDGENRYNAESNFAFAYLDVSATQYMGIMPGGTEFRAWYRNFSDSPMMFVSGPDFALYVSYQFTTLDAVVFDTLPTLEGQNPLTFCDAAWCNGPGPTPTPTGFGPLAAVIAQATPPATQSAQGTPGAQTAQSLVSWNNIRVTYLVDNPATRTAQVALEICVQPAQAATACEPVTSVTDVTTGAPRTPVSQFNGLNVYELPYGYSSNLRLDGATLYSNDVWISDPTIR